MLYRNCSTFNGANSACDLLAFLILSTAKCSWPVEDQLHVIILISSVPTARPYERRQWRAGGLCAIVLQIVPLRCKSLTHKHNNSQHFPTWFVFLYVPFHCEVCRDSVAGTERRLLSSWALSLLTTRLSISAFWMETGDLNARNEQKRFDTCLHNWAFSV